MELPKMTVVVDCLHDNPPWSSWVWRCEVECQDAGAVEEYQEASSSAMSWGQLEVLDEEADCRTVWV